MRELLLTSFGGGQYGIWKDAILSVRDIHALHRIPLSPARIAGIMVEEGQAVTLADLSGCIGFEPSAATDQGCIILMAEGDKVTGFVVSGELRTQSISPNSLFPLPDYLKTPVFDTCAVHDGISIPIINIAELYSRVLKSGDEPSIISPWIAAAQPEDIPVAGRIRYFSAAGENYSVSASGMDDKAVKPGPITPLPDTPQYVKGVTFRDGRLLPVIDLTQRIKRLSGAAESLMLIARVADHTFGFLIDGDEGASSAGKVSIKLLPLIAQTPWLKKVVVRAGELIPLVDLAMALSPVSGGADDKPVWQRYAPASGFPALFASLEVEVVEFLLLGVRHALPKVEMEEVIAFKPSRTLPDVLPIVIGVAEHNGEILPVVDLAMMFGRRSLTTPAWRMMLVNNGDFRALVITEAVFGERRLPLEIHRTVPIHLPHNLMYGCYPDGQAVRIILNVEAISVHFEKSLIQKFMPALSHEMRMSPTGVLYTFPGEEAGEVPPPVATGARAETAVPARAQAIPAPEAATESEPMNVEVAAASPARSPEAQATVNALGDHTTLQQEQVPPIVAVPEETIAPEPAAMNEESAGEVSSVEPNKDLAQKGLATASADAVPEFEQQAEAGDAEFVDWEDAEPMVHEIAPEPAPIDVAAAAVSEKAIVPETNKDVEITPEKTPEPTVQSHSAAVSTSSGERDMERAPAITGKQSALEALKASAKKKKAKKISESANVDGRPAESMRTTASVKPGEPHQMNRKEQQLAVLSGHQERAAGKMRKRRIGYGAIVAVLVAVFYFSVSSEKPHVEKSAQGTEPVKIEPALVQPIQSAQSGQSNAGAVPGNAKTEPAKEKVQKETARVAQAKSEAEQAESKAKAEREAKAHAQTKAKAKQILVLSPLVDEKTEALRSAEKSRAPLELDIPANMPVGTEVYVVQEGDTLWSISEHFTGNPYNYPRIAGENRIANPDLIFPGQRIRLIK
jgi:chemotaxis signal transduction protein/nucleoid-associated protein YgaU